MAKAPKLKPFEESAAYENFVETLAAQLAAWRGSDEPAGQFARRVTGLMREADKEWRRE